MSCFRESATAWMQRERELENILVERLWRSFKHEDVNLKSYSSSGEITIGLMQFFEFYNS
ncbi:hypothetical protein DN062_02195 [Nitrincola tibetensis]|uniref:Uncharacterized protein n=1 Tax=Nitrincola tibetensis TaxID=2219697 RepID=A0A364NSM3_9GAMM|nr:hypothetical protein DN062_02195 [Nitrincola tibetensis]